MSEQGTPGPSTHRVLFLGANPTGTQPLALQKEADAIRGQLGVDRPRARFEFKVVKNAEPSELLRELNDLKPTVVHFACHGRSPQDSEPTDDAYRHVRAAEWTPGLYLQGSDNRRQFVSAKTLRRTFAVAGRSVKLVVFNACYSKPIARGVRRYVDCVVGMNGAIRDDAAQSFATELYRCLAQGGSVEAAVRVGKLAIELLGLPGHDLPKLRVRKGIAADELVLRPDSGGKRLLHAVAATLRLGYYLAGVPGTAVALTLFAAGALIVHRGWLALGDTSLDLRTQWVAVEAGSPPEAVQGNGEVRAITAQQSTVERASVAMNASDLPRRIALTGTFNAIELGRGDPACRWIFEARDGGLAIRRVASSEQTCAQDIAVRAGPGGLELRLDDDPPISVPPRERLVVHSPPGEPITLAPHHAQIVLFRPANDVVWPVNGLRGVAAAGERLHLPGALRSSDVFELNGTVELRELMLDNGRMIISGSLRHWSGTVGRREDWNSAAPWPRLRYCWMLLVFVVAPYSGWLIAIMLRRRRNWGRESP